MKTINAAVKAFIQDEEGVTAIEYGLIASLIALAVGTAMSNVSTELEAVFGRVVDALTP